MRTLLNKTTITILALASFPLAAFANIPQTNQTLNSSQTLNLDTGAVGSTGTGDILWNGASFILQGNATAFNIINGGTNGLTQFTSLLQGGATALQLFTYSKTTPFSTPNSIFAVKTNGGNYALVLVVSINISGSIQLTYATFGSTSGSGGSGGPSISQVLNNYSLIPVGFPNSGIAQGALFIIKGSGLASSSNPSVVHSSSPNAADAAGQYGPLPTSYNGTTVSVTVNGTTTTPAIYYALPTQLALVLPSNTPTGNATVTVSYNGQTSAPFSFTVVTSAMGFDAYYGAGTGLGVAVNTTPQGAGSLYTYASTIVPGQTILLYGSGLGADPARDTTYTPAAFSINGLAHIYIGGVDSPIVYQGASGYPGLNQVNVTIPTNAPTGCNVSLVGVTPSGVPTNIITLPIGTGAPCSDPAYGITDGRQLTTLSAQTNVRTGFVGVAQTTSNGQVTDIVSGIFEQVSGASYGAASSSASLNSCIVNQLAASSVGTVPTINGMDAGTVTVTGPVGGTQTLTTIPGYLGIYEATTGQGGTLPSGFVPSTGGQFAFHGSGGTSSPLSNDVGNFSVTVSLSNPLMTWNNQSAASTVTRSAGLPVAWSNAAVGSFVIISGSSSSSGASGSFTCFVPGSAGQFTVPSYVLSALPAGSGSVSVSNYTNYNTFTANNLDFGFAAGYVSYSVTSTVN